ncbi:MAG TPA: metal ABC transporter ATP-binding protein [Methylomirabilota bacterium]|nr:metal ABC transporter ATP-binding protein [Methylomirabilota bacterium]
MANEPVVECRDVRVRFGSEAALDGVTLSIPRGQLVAIIGPNGSGKTTLLRTMLGLQRPTSGEVRLFGNADLRPGLKRVGYVPQRLALDRSFALSVREFMSLRLRQTRHWFFHRRRHIDSLLESHLQEIGALDTLDQSVATLSGGQLQRVLIAFSLLHDPELLLLDEPTAGVDTPGELSFYELIGKVHQKRGITVALVSHDLSMVHRHASWVYALNQVVCCEGSPEDIMNAESLKKAYGIHVSPYHHHHHHEGGHHHHAH